MRKKCTLTQLPLHGVEHCVCVQAGAQAAVQGQAHLASESRCSSIMWNSSAWRQAQMKTTLRGMLKSAWDPPLNSALSRLSRRADSRPSMGVTCMRPRVSVCEGVCVCVRAHASRPSRVAKACQDSRGLLKRCMIDASL